MKLFEWLATASARLRSAGVESAQIEAQLLVAHLFGSDRAWVVAHPEQEVLELPAERLLQRREAGEPLAYILGRREFYGRNFSVRKGVLIPRQETELLIDLAPRFATVVSPRVLDLGTGSGCIAITLKLEHPAWSVVGGDVSAEALEIAHENADDQQAEVEWVQTDLFAGFQDGEFDLIVTNPPYVELDAELKDEVKNWEPSLALFAPQETFSIYRRLANEGGRVLRPGAALIAEIGAGQRKSVQEIFESKGWIGAGVWTDLAGIERVVAFKQT